MYSEILSDLVIEKVYSVSSVYNESGRRLKRENRPNWAIVLKYEGETVYTVADKQYISNKNNMVILPKGSTYEIQLAEPGHYYIIEFECKKKYDGILHFPLRSSDKIFEIFKKTEYKMDLKNPVYQLECINNTYSVILNLFKEYSKKYVPGTKQQKIQPAVEYITRNYNKKIKNNELAELTGFSTDYFRKMFYDVYGMSPIEYVNNLRMKKAGEMLMSDYISITDIAISLGYDNIYDFSRSFKKSTGVSPSKFKK